MKRIFTLLATLWLAAWMPGTSAQVSEEAVKAAFLYRFASFVEWPAEMRGNDGVVIGVLNSEEVESELRGYIKRKRASIGVKRVDDLDDIAGVHILFIGARENGRLSNLTSSLRKLPILIVTEAPDGLSRGGMINFVTTDRVQFEVAVDTALQAGIRLNARLLSVAMRVRKGHVNSDELLTARDRGRRAPLSAT